MVLDVAGRRVLVTGAAGFIGAHLIQSLSKRGAHVTGLVRETTDAWRWQALGVKPEVAVADLRDHDRIAAIVARCRPEIVFHLAVARDAADRRGMLETNVNATLNLLACTAASGLKRFVHLGSSLEYGRAPHGSAPDDLLRPVNCYGATRAAASVLIRQAIDGERVPATILRTYYVYGPLQPSDRLIPTAVSAALTGTRLKLTEPSFRRDFVFVDDVVHACLLAACLGAANGRELNIATGIQTTNTAIVDMIGRLTGRPINVDGGSFSPRPWDRADWPADITSMQEVLDWKPETNLYNGLRHSIRSIRKSKHLKPMTIGCA